MDTSSETLWFGRNLMSWDDTLKDKRSLDKSKWGNSPNNMLEFDLVNAPESKTGLCITVFQI